MSMKKNVLCVFALIFYALLACTVLAWGVEEIMMVRVELTPINGKAAGKVKVTRTFSGDKMIFTDESGDHVYQVVEGEGWSTGSTAMEVVGWTFEGNALKIEGTPYDYYVRSASRQPTAGKSVKVVEEFTQAEDQYLATYAEGIIEWLRDTGSQRFGINYLPEHGELAAGNDHILLIDMSDVTLPFMERTARNLDDFQVDCLGYAESLFSLTEVENFFHELPYVGILAALALFPVFLWAVTCIALWGKIPRRSGKVMAAVNTVLTFGALGGMILLFYKIDLPSSLLPSSVIFDFDYYTEEFDLIRQSLQEIGARQDIVSMIETVPAQSVQIFLIGLELSLGFALAEWLIVRVLCNRGK